MTNEERDLITRFIERVGGAAASGGFAGSVPNSQPPNLPPVDHDADALIGDLFQRNPEARYRITQLAFVQEQALMAAQQRIQAQQAQLQQAQQQLQQGSGQSQGGGSPWGAGQPQAQQHRGFFGSLFGGGGSQQSSAPPPGYQPQPPPQYAPQYNSPASMFRPQGSGFLGGALQTAAGVAGGLVAGEALMNLFEGHHGGGGFFGSDAAMQGPGFGAAPVADSPWGAAAVPAADPYDQGGALKTDAANDPYAAGQVADNSGWAPAPAPAPDQGQAGWQPAADDSGWQQAPDTGSDQGGWDSGSNAGDGGWTDSSNDA
jgi:hypothetical protein